MNRFLWLVRREVAEHRAIWIAPAIVIGCLFLLLMLARAHENGSCGERNALGPTVRKLQERLPLAVDREIQVLEPGAFAEKGLE